MNADPDASTAGDGLATPVKPLLFRHWPATLLVVLLLTTGSLVGLAGSESGLRALCRLAEVLAGGLLVIEEPSGTLSRSFAVRSVRWHATELDVEVQELRVDWRPLDLLRGRFSAERIAAVSVRVFSAADSEPMKRPESLRWPLAVDIEQLSLGQWLVGDYAHRDADPWVLAEDLVARWSSDFSGHHLSPMRARVAGLAVAGEASLAAEPPFALTAKAVLEGTTGLSGMALDLTADGPLDAFTVSGRARWPTATASKAASAEGLLHMALFHKQTVQSAVVHLSGIEPRLWFADAPQALVDLHAELLPVDEVRSDLTGRLSVVNRLAGSLDRQRLPLEELHTSIQRHNGLWELHEIEAQLGAGGRLRGDGTLRGGDLLLNLVASAVNAKAWHAALQPTQLAGSLRVALGAGRQQVKADLRDARFVLAGELRIDAQTVVVDRLLLAAGEAQLIADARFDRREGGALHARAELRHFDPSRFAKLPTAQINADFALDGHREPQLALAGRFALRDSRIGRETLVGHGQIDVVGRRLRKADVDLQVAGNRLSVQGALGEPGDRLALSIAAPRLEALGIAGDLDGRLLLEGRVEAPQLAATLHSQRLEAASVGRLQGLELTATLGDGKEGLLAGHVHLAGVDRADGQMLLRDLALDVDGVRSRHRLRGQVAVGGPHRLQWLLAGGLAAAPSDAWWVGALQEWSLSSRFDQRQPLLHLAASMPLELGRQTVRAGPAQLLGVGWSARVERLHGDSRGWQSAGSLRGLPLIAVREEFPQFSDALSAVASGNRGGLRVSGEWDVGVPQTAGVRPSVQGQARLWREDGDLTIGSLPLGLQVADVVLRIRDGRYDARLALRGLRLGELHAELSAAGTADSWLDRAAAWSGKLTLHTTDLAWLGPLIGEGWQTGGRLAVDVALAGTPTKPHLSGEWRGDELALRALDSGMRLERGQLRGHLQDSAAGAGRLIVEGLTFESDLQSMPRTLLLDSSLDAAPLTAKPGRLQVTGEMDLAQGGYGVLNVHADRLGIVQRPEQWLLASGDGQVKLGERALEVGGRVQLDAAYWELAKSGSPQLSDDVVIQGRGGRPTPPSVHARLLSVDLTADLGRHFHFRGAGVESRLTGTLRIRSDGFVAPRATGSIRTIGGRFDAYGQQLDIERGILNFQGLIDNPGLNIRAVRPNLPVEAGVEVGGTAKRPLLRLVSDPPVPDAEKLSWLVLGHAPDQQSGQDSSILLAAGRALLGGQDGGALRALQRSLGIDEFAIGSGTVDGSGHRQTSRIASSTGFGTVDTATGQIVSIGKRLSSKVLLSYEQSLNASGSLVKLTVDLSRNFSFVGRAGSDNALDLLWNYRFGR